MGHYTNDLVYERLAPGVLDELKERTPRFPSGTLRNKYFQWFTPEFGHPKLKEHLIGVMALMRAAPNWGAFKRALQRAYPKLNEQAPLTGRRRMKGDHFVLQRWEEDGLSLGTAQGLLASRSRTKRPRLSLTVGSQAVNCVACNAFIHAQVSSNLYSGLGETLAGIRIDELEPPTEMTELPNWMGTALECLRLRYSWPRCVCDPLYRLVDGRGETRLLPPVSIFERFMNKILVL